MLKIKSIKLETVKRVRYDLDKITKTENVFDVMQKIGVTQKAQEYVYLVGLAEDNTINCIANIGIGGINYNTIDTRVVFQYLFLSNSTKFIIVHNHPSGNLNPSNLDIKATNQLQNMAEILQFNLLDHIIVTQDSYKSILEK